jgi:hypothetical protein
MPYKRKDSPYWWVSFIAPSGERIRLPIGTKDKREAEVLETKWKLEAYRQRHWDEQPSRTFEELITAYLKATACKRSHDKDLQRTNHCAGFLAVRRSGRYGPRGYGAISRLAAKRA